MFDLNDTHLVVQFMWPLHLYKSNAAAYAM